MLLHQHVLAGVGNVFKSEVCFVERINPFCLVAALTEEQINALISTAQRLVAANVLEDSGNMIVTYRGQHRRTTHSPARRTACGSTGDPAIPAAVVVPQFVIVSKDRMRASPSGVQLASQCLAAMTSMGTDQAVCAFIARSCAT